MFRRLQRRLHLQSLHHTIITHQSIPQLIINIHQHINLIMIALLTNHNFNLSLNLTFKRAQLFSNSNCLIFKHFPFLYKISQHALQLTARNHIGIKLFFINRTAVLTGGAMEFIIGLIEGIELSGAGKCDIVDF